MNRLDLRKKIDTETKIYNYLTECLWIFMTGRNSETYLWGKFIEKILMLLTLLSNKKLKNTYETLDQQTEIIIDEDEKLKE